MKNNQRASNLPLKILSSEDKSIVKNLCRMAEALSTPAWIADAQGYAYWFNQKWFSFSGTTAKEMENWAWQTFYHPDHIGRVIQKYLESIEKKTLWEDNFPLKAANGRYVWVLGRAMPILNAQGSIVCWFGYNILSHGKN